jgi:hypothetical protein
MKDWIPGSELKLTILCRNWSFLLSNEQTITNNKWDQALCTYALGPINAYLTAVDAFALADTTSNRTAKNDTKKKAIVAMRQFATTSIRNNPYMDVAAREDMGLRIPDTVPTTNKKPVAVPNTTIEPTVYPFQHRIYARNFENGGKGKPAGVHGVRFVWQVGGDRPNGGADILMGQFSRKPEIIITHKEGDRGKIVYYSSCYENTRGEAGPWSLIEETYIG